MRTEDASIDLTGVWAPGPAGPGWVWSLEVVRDDVLDDPEAVLAYQADSPVQAVREALDDASTWT